MPKKYGKADAYERKLDRVMERIGVEKYNFNWDRFGSWIDFTYKNERYRFEHSIEKAKEHGINITSGSDTFAQIVLSLEDLARMASRGIYDLQTLAVGMKFLASPIPECFRVLGFDHIPTREEIDQRFRKLAKVYHPDVGGTDQEFINLKKAEQDAIRYLEEHNE